MTHKHAFEVMDRSFRDIMKQRDYHLATRPFGRKIVVRG